MMCGAHALRVVPKMNRCVAAVGAGGAVAHEWVPSGELGVLEGAASRSGASGSLLLFQYFLAHRLIDGAATRSQGGYLQRGYFLEGAWTRLSLVMLYNLGHAPHADFMRQLVISLPGRYFWAFLLTTYAVLIDLERAYPKVPTLGGYGDVFLGGGVDQIITCMLYNFDHGPPPHAEHTVRRLASALEADM